MGTPNDYRTWLNTDEDVVIVRVLANDPRGCPTECIVVGGPAQGVTLANLEALAVQLRDECGWGLGHEEDISKRGGGIGAEGAAILSLVLGVIGTVPTVLLLFSHLRRQVPERPDRDEALETATWAVVMQYYTVDRRSLEVVGEARDPDHWTFTLRHAASNDQFEVEVFGSRARTFATRVVWVHGEPWGRLPGTA